MKLPKPDKNGVFVFDASPLKRIPLMFLIVFSVIIIALSVYYIIIGVYTGLQTSVIRIVSCVAVFGISVFMLIKRDRYIITNEKVMLYGKWEAYFSEITSVSLHDNIFGFVEIQTENGILTVPSSDISCSLKVFAEILSERTKIAEKKENHSK